MVFFRHQHKQNLFRNVILIFSLCRKTRHAFGNFWKIRFEKKSILQYLHQFLTGSRVTKNFFYLSFCCSPFSQSSKKPKAIFFIIHTLYFYNFANGSRRNKKRDVFVSLPPRLFCDGDAYGGFIFFWIEHNKKRESNNSIFKKNFHEKKFSFIVRAVPVTAPAPVIADLIRNPPQSTAIQKKPNLSKIFQDWFPPLAKRRKRMQIRIFENYFQKQFFLLVKDGTPPARIVSLRFL